jgi:excisionase family DNA binding protein
MSMTEQRPALLTTREAGQVLGLHRRTVAQLVAKGALPGIKIDQHGNWRLPRAEVERLIGDDGRAT